MGKEILYGNEIDEQGNKYTTVRVYGEDCKDAKTVFEEINEIVRKKIQSANPGAFYKHLIKLERLEPDCVEVNIRGNFVEAFFEAGYTC